MKIRMVTLGCKVNQYESQAILQGFETQGHTAALLDDVPDVVVINSCTVTAESDHKVRQTLRRVRREAPDAIIVLTGCMVQAFPEMSAALPEADLIIGNREKTSIPAQVAAFIRDHRRVVSVPAFVTGTPFEPMAITGLQDHTRAFVKIEDGCNRFCSYCIIPYARGRVRSKSPADLQAEVRALAEAGYREVVLTGINLSAYGQELGVTLCDAVETAAAVEGIRRVRLGSLEPEQLDGQTIERLAGVQALCPQFHLSLQSGCDRTLRAMRRHYTAAEYRQIVENLRAVFPGCALTTDVMVGFSGETPEDFETSLAFVREMAFAKVHVFPYSRRPGTAAYDAPGVVSNAEKQRRARRMAAACEESRLAYFQAQVGSSQAVLAETPLPDGSVEGHAANYTPVRAASMEPGGFFTVDITGFDENGCFGVCRGPA